MKIRNTLLPKTLEYINNIDSEFEQISQIRKSELNELGKEINTMQADIGSVKLIFICTHNSRRSHMSQLWAQAASHYYNIHNIYCYSGGTEATTFNPRSVKALRKAGFEIKQIDKSSNPTYQVKFAAGDNVVTGFSKTYNNEFNPQENFIAVLTCSHADENCPVVFGASERIALTYEDPKIADNTQKEEAIYDERCRQIAVKMFYLFSNV